MCLMAMELHRSTALESSVFWRRNRHWILLCLMTVIPQSVSLGLDNIHSFPFLFILSWTDKKDGLFMPMHDSIRISIGGRRGQVFLSRLYSHSLEFQYMVYWDPTGQQHFHQTTLLDGEVVFHCESPALQDQPRQEWVTHTLSALHLREREEYCRDQNYQHIHMLKEINNVITQAVDILQRRRGCIINSSGVFPFDKWGVNGKDFLTFDPQSLKWTPLSFLALPVAQEWNRESIRNQVYGEFGQNECMKTHNLLAQRRAAWITHRARQDMEVRVYAKSITGSMDTALLCQVIDMDLSGLIIHLTEDGQPLEKGLELIGPLANGDGTSQIQLQVEISVNRTKQYQCEVESDSINISVPWDGHLLAEQDLGSPVILGVVCASVLLFIISVCYIHLRWKGHAGYKKITLTEDSQSTPPPDPQA